MALESLLPTANAAETGAGLTNPNNAMSFADAVYATAAPGKNVTLATKYQNFHFDRVIATGAAITKVEIIYVWKASVNTSIATARTYAKIGGVAQANHDDATEPAGDTTNTVDITADRSWTRDDLLDGIFEVALSAVQGNSNTAVTFSFDSVQVRVTFSKETTVFNNYQQVSVVSAGIMSVTEKIR